MKMSAQYAPELILLDLGLPDLDGIEIVARVRAWSGIPIIVVSARMQEAQKVIALDAGADDYLTKPFGIDELLARIRAALRRSLRAREPAAPVFTSGPLKVDLERRRVELDGEEVRLTAIEYKLLAVLVAHAGRVVTHKQLLELVWGPESGEQTQYLRVYIGHLRRKLEPNPLRARLFFTEVGVGYRLLVSEE
jgi:two-component system, OmpR family, KDP operon response regulator KdpE